ncbi:unnamed protein product [Polarella glacialis]|uniref:Uncharacterized protein n=1 Tax=Polarella glacialis TaxID=89957 RepID=A0A813KKN6_POLGL|nr:unnamed protein product [Polarella glacialis]
MLSDEFTETSTKLHGLIHQVAIRLIDLIARVNQKHRESPQMLLEPANFDRLVEVFYLIATANYRMCKWLHQLDPQTFLKPARPSKPVDHNPDELLKGIQFLLSRSEVVASNLAPKLYEILSDAKALRKGPNGEPLTPNGRNPTKLAEQRGIKDVSEMQGLALHLERLLEVAQNLIHKSVGAATFASTGTVLRAFIKFKRLLAKAKARRGEA